VQGKEIDRREEWIALAPRPEKIDVAVNEAVEEHVAVGAEDGARERAREGKSRSG
jgi:hypothetical protein